jgi:polyphosphate glucokinase
VDVSAQATEGLDLEPDKPTLTTQAPARAGQTPAAFEEEAAIDAAVSEPPHELALGFDLGGTGVKAALVNLGTGQLVSQRVRVKTPIPSVPAAVADTMKGLFEIISKEVDIPASAPVGCGLPGVLKNGRLLSAANIDKGWLEVSAEEVIGAAVGRRVYCLNDADAAGLAEVRFGAGKGVPGTVLLLTIGTGIGSAIFTDGHLVLNTELGHFRWRNNDAEKRISGTARERRHISWRKWATEFSEFLAEIEVWLNPDLIILSGGVSKEMPRYAAYLKTRALVVPAHFLNSAGIVGAAMYAGLSSR